MRRRDQTEGRADADRFALQLLSPAAVLSKLSGRTEITVEDVAENSSLFLDARSSARLLAPTGTVDNRDGRAEYMR